jgi:hypothetical protein
MKNVFFRRLATNGVYGRSGWDVRIEARDSFIKFMGDDIKVNKRYHMTAVTVPTLQDCLQDFPKDWSVGDRELGLFILLQGDLEHHYPVDGPMHALALLAEYGVSWERSYKPEMGKWSEFVGTFDEPAEESKLEIQLVRKDANDKGYIGSYSDRFSFGIDMPSIADIIKASSGLFLKQLES